MHRIPNPFRELYGIILGFLLVVGGPFIGIGATEAYRIWAETRQAVAVQGTVVANTYQETSPGDGAYFPVVRFTPHDGADVQFTDGGGSLPPDYAVDSPVTVLYDPADVHHARIRSWKRLWLAPTIFIVVGALPLIVYGLWLVHMRRA
ncbi:MAG: DUF3592 domain-containing protein [Oscillochloris sp.]|nr:DUF3592 domain-containing protein [Oscillochloris sp.]